MKSNGRIGGASGAAPKIGSWVAFLLRIFVGGILLYAGFSKAMGPSAEFAAAINAYRILPPALVTPLALGLPWMEMEIGIFLLAGFCTGWAALGSTALFLVFLGALGSSLFRGIDLVSCGCFGSERFSPRQTIWLDAGLLIASIWLVARRKKPQVMSFENL